MVYGDFMQRNFFKDMDVAIYTGGLAEDPLSLESELCIELSKVLRIPLTPELWMTHATQLPAKKAIRRFCWPFVNLRKTFKSRRASKSMGKAASEFRRAVQVGIVARSIERSISVWENLLGVKASSATFTRLTFFLSNQQA
jgi:hypothetical protein